MSQKAPENLTNSLMTIVALFSGLLAFYANNLTPEQLLIRLMMYLCIFFIIFLNIFSFYIKKNGQNFEVRV